MGKEEYKEKIIELCNQQPAEYALEWLDKVKTHNVKIIFGGGQLGSVWIDIWEYYGIKPDYIADNNKEYWGKTIKGIQYISPDELVKYRQEMIVLIAVRDYQAIYEQLIRMGFDDDNILIASIDTRAIIANYMITNGRMSGDDLSKSLCKVIDCCEDELSAKILYQTMKRYICDLNEDIDYTEGLYFISEIGRKEHEIFVDAGAYDGDTLESVLSIYGNSFDKYFAFELDEVNYQNLCKKVADFPKDIRNKIVVYNMGLWSEKREVTYDSSKSTTTISKVGNSKGVVDRLDNVLKDEKVTFIKMDIEGAEMDALKGCEEHIRRYRPTLAISIYHSVYDFVNIPIMLKNFGYKIVIRHHDLTAATEIVCYAYN